jgi:hypothetical protein
MKFSFPPREVLIFRQVDFVWIFFLMNFYAGFTILMIFFYLDLFVENSSVHMGTIISCHPASDLVQQCQACLPTVHFGFGKRGELF